MKFLTAALISTFLLFGESSFSAERLLVVGGGKRPAAAVEKFAKTAGEESGRILVIAWASEFPQEAVEGFKKDIAPYFAGMLDASLKAPSHELERFRFLNQLSLASGVFFSGGSQVRIMSAFSEPGGEELLKAILKKYESGTVFGGTSAGAAIMSNPMITGGDSASNVQLAPGLGLAHPPAQPFIIDQHFSQRKREDRLLGAMKIAGVQHGLGIDEDTAVWIVDRSSVTVIGDFVVRAFSLSEDKVREKVLRRGESFNLISWETASSVSPANRLRMSLTNISE